MFSEVFFMKALLSFTRAPLLEPNYLPKALSPDTITLGLALNMNFAGTQTFIL